MSDELSPTQHYLNNMSAELLQEARRQVEICNACRFCEGYCAVFPAMTRKRIFSDGDITQLANLCHNCRGCYYACQYTAPHEFNLNVPQALARVRQDSWTAFAAPAGFARLFQRNGVAIAVFTVLTFALLFLAIRALPGSTGGTGFYRLLSHSAMVVIFLPAFVLPIVSITISMRRYRNAINEAVKPVNLATVRDAFKSAATMKNLAGGHGEGCNFEDEDRFTPARRLWHQLTVIGFLLCFASTTCATIMHYAFDLPAPYGFWTLPKLLGVSGGLLLSTGTLMLLKLKRHAARELSDERAWGGETAFILLLFFVSTSGLCLYALGGTAALGTLLALHLGSVLAFFLLLPYTKMAHGFYRMMALIEDARY